MVANLPPPYIEKVSSGVDAGGCFLFYHSLVVPFDACGPYLAISRSCRDIGGMAHLNASVE